MKKLLGIILVTFVFFTIAGCGKTKQETTLPDYMEDALTENTGELNQPESINASGEIVMETESARGMSDGINFNFETKTVMLNSGYEMPIYGIGTYSLLDEVCVDSVLAALERGVRLIDTAYMYHNEESVGEAVRLSGIPRDEIFVTTKLYPNQFADPEKAINEALEKLDIGYIDARVIIGLS